MSPVLTTASVPDQDQFGYWGAAMSKSFMPVSTTRRADGPFSGQISTDRLGFLQLCTVEAEAHRVDRARTHIARSTEEFVVLAVQTAGTAILFQAGRQATASQGDLLVYDAGRPYFLDYPETFSNHSIQIPRRALGVPDEDLHRVTGTVIDRSAGCGAVLTPFLTTLMTSASSYPAALAHGIASSTADLFATLVDEQIRTAVTGREPLCGFLLPRIRDHIDRNLDDPALGPEAIAKEHHISVRYLHRLFEAEEPPSAGSSRGADWRCARANSAAATGPDHLCHPSHSGGALSAPATSAGRFAKPTGSLPVNGVGCAPVRVVRYRASCSA